ncbi:hypothetical protein [Nocardioides litoris]|uniref:hypothetical protein n=1 Tax=Nocardioides litoris TaxID=1926648 RepID=UPI00147776E5|nr:hypothetical protein [Nocardioides litoris]
MHDYMTIQAEMDYRRERVSRAMGASRPRRRGGDRTRVPFVAGREDRGEARRAR